MKIEIFRAPEFQTIYEFAEIHDLKMEVRERSPDPSPTRWYAHFVHGETKESDTACILCGSYGDGCTIGAAIEAYAKEISGKILVINAHSDERQQIFVPRLI